MARIGVAMKRTKAYQAYRDRFYQEKRRGNIISGLRVLSQNQFKNAMKVKTKSGSNKYTTRKLLNMQMKITTKAAERETWKTYLKMRRSIERGEKITVSDSFMGLARSPEGGISASEAETMQSESGLGYHYNISGLLKDNYVLHDIIAFRISDGEDQKEVLADYGY